jgi:hypothetical protein
MSVKKVTGMGLFICLTYFSTVLVQIVFHNTLTLYLVSAITMLSGLFMALLVASFPINDKAVQLYRTMAIICVSACMILTNAVHITNIAVIMPLVDRGTPVAEVFQIGQYPSVLMGVDYLGWGLFMGLAFILSGCFIDTMTNLKKFLMLCGCLCLSGFIGVFFNENFWYIAPLGYGAGTAIICVKLLRYSSCVEKLQK